MIEQSPILVTGCARSGTSMVAGAIDICGAFGGRLSPPNKNNKKGMFENYSIRQDVVKPYLKQISVDPLGQYPLPDISHLWIPRKWKEQVQTVFTDQGYKEGQWYYKGAKMCLMWPVWQYAFPTAKWIIVRRRTADIVKSCLKTSFMQAFRRSGTQEKVNVQDEKEGWKWWVHQHEARFVEMIESGMNCKQIWPERMVDGDYGQLYETLEWLGLDWVKHSGEILNFIDPKLWKSRRK